MASLLPSHGAIDRQVVEEGQEYLFWQDANTSFVAKRYQVVPLCWTRGLLSLGVATPLEPFVLNALSFAFGCEVRPIIIPPDQLASLLACYAGRGEDTIEDEVRKKSLLTEVEVPGLAMEVKKLLNEVIDLQVSDLHLEASEQSYAVRYRINGIFYEKESLPKNKGLAMISQLKIMAGLDITQQRLPQDGRLEQMKTGVRVAFRLATLPTQFGESLVLRLLDPRIRPLHITALQLQPLLQQALLSAIAEPHGLFLVTGPTGSGKTTTLYSCLQYLDQEALKLMTVEDPVEYEQEGMMQISVNPSVGLTFPRVLRSLLRHDPDIIMVGEMRDPETARIGLQAALTGHRVFTTLHTNDAIGAVARLLDMGMERAIVATTLSAVLAQRLLKKICPACRDPYQPDKSLLLKLGLSSKKGRVVFYRGKGCHQCGQTGYRGRAAIFELLLMNDSLRLLMTQHGSLREKAIEQGMIPLRAEALRLLHEGVTTVEEVLEWT